MNKRIFEVRQSASLSMRAFGDRIGISGPSVARIESGENNPSEQTIRAICQEFNVNRDWLVDGIGVMEASRPFIPELMRVLRNHPDLKAALELLVEDNDPEFWAALNTVARRLVEQRRKKEAE
jgi:transcriptional regulator with XRE-family HTH domain